MTIDVIAAARRRTRRLAWTLTLGLLVVAGVAALAGLHQATPPTPSRPATPHTEVSTRVVQPSGGQAALLPADTQWVRIVGVELPISAQAGPYDTAGGRARGFAHTPAGAVLAALHLVVRTTAEVGPAIFEPTLREQVVGPDATAMARVVADTYTQTAAQRGITFGEPLGNLPAAVVGARVDTYTAEAAQLTLLTRASDGSGIARFAATTVTVSFIGGDWRLVAPSDGRWDSHVRIVTPDSAAAFPPLRT